MRFEHDFALPVPVALAWPALLDAELVDEFLPDGEVTRTGAGAVSGKLRVRVGRNAVTYTGTVRITESDPAAGRLAVSVEAREARGEGTVTGTITAAGRDDGTGSLVSVTANLEVTGRAATFAGAALTDAGARLIDRFAAALSDRLTADLEGSTAPTGQRPAESAEPSEPSGPTEPADEPVPPRPPRPTDAGTERDRVELVEPDPSASGKRRIGVIVAGVVAALLWRRRRRRRARHAQR